MAPIPVGIAAIYLSTWKLAGEWVVAPGEKIDLTGSILYGAAIVLFMYGVSVLPSSESLWAICLGSALGGVFVWWEWKAPSPVVNLELFRQNKIFALSSLAALINSSATFAVGFMLSLYLQYIKGLTPQASGLALMALPVVMAIFSPVAGRLSDRVHPGKTCLIRYGRDSSWAFCDDVSEISNQHDLHSIGPGLPRTWGCSVCVSKYEYDHELSGKEILRYGIRNFRIDAPYREYAQYGDRHCCVFSIPRTGSNNASAPSCFVEMCENRLPDICFAMCCRSLRDKRRAQHYLSGSVGLP